MPPVVNRMRTTVTDSKTPPQSELGYQRSIAQPSDAADNNPPKKATTAKGRRRRRHSRAMRKSHRRGRRGTRRR